MKAETKDSVSEATKNNSQIVTESKEMTWLERINTAEKVDGFTQKDIDDANQWQWIVCGERKEVSAKQVRELDLTAEARAFERQFAKAVEDGDYGKAKQIHNQIKAMETVLQ